MIVLAAARSTFELGRSVTVSDVVERAGVGRNTFYVHFSDLPAAFAAAESEAFAVIAGALATAGDARTPIERLRRMALEWLSVAASEPHLVMLAIRGDGTPRGVHVRLRESLENVLRGIAASARAAGVIGRPVDGSRLKAVAGAFVTFGERIIEENRRIDADRYSEELVDFSLRAMR